MRSTKGCICSARRSRGRSIAKRQIEIARQVGADAVAMARPARAMTRSASSSSYYALQPDIKVIAPWREWDLTSRTKLIEFAEQNQIPVAKDKRGEAPFSTDANMLHTSSEGKVLEDPWEEVPDYVYSRTVNPEDAPDTPEIITVDFERGDGVALNGSGHVARHAARSAQRSWPQAWHRPARSGRKPLRRHEIARHV